ncbi:alpha/beta hydrolase [Dyadobacter sandarakinus]|uniref:Alpha/beta hydrolase n=1 Tax=Dyadobacter sandarakinus TaxID=2747268 RepID=A0ABX7I1S8_9BACT|nr:alpha/beta hydrolase [Dyadobacter sandarakinus]QRQ99884.1 alpha/beta hydrolase [Dyadobacter sandarakinus]
MKLNKLHAGLLAAAFTFAQLHEHALAQQNEVIPLWKNGAPGFESRAKEPEQAKDYWVKNIHNPSLEVFLPEAGKGNGTAVVVCPGGGFRLLVYNAEGVEPAQYLARLGVTVFVLKYRLPREDGSPYSLDKQPREDALRAMRQVRSLASRYHINPSRVGMLGFSAGGEVVASVAYTSGKGETTAKDPIDRLDGRPDFQMLIYPGPLGIPDKVPQDAPPAFLLAANDDPCCAVTTVDLLTRYREAKRPVEAHLYTKGDHGFNMGNRSDRQSIKSWPQRLADWLADNGYLKKD